MFEIGDIWYFIRQKSEVIKNTSKGGKASCYLVVEIINVDR
jgi:hypothetical protein